MPDKQPLSLCAALQLLAEVHTRGDLKAGFTVHLGAMPDEPHHRQHHVEAWRVVRQAVGLPTEPEN